MSPFHRFESMNQSIGWFRKNALSPLEMEFLPRSACFFCASRLRRFRETGFILRYSRTWRRRFPSSCKIGETEEIRLRSIWKNHNLYRTGRRWRVSLRRREWSWMNEPAVMWVAVIAQADHVRDESEMFHLSLHHKFVSRLKNLERLEFRSVACVFFIIIKNLWKE